MAKGDKCLVNTCNNIITYKGTVCGTHKWRWGKFKSYDLPGHLGPLSYCEIPRLDGEIIHVCRKKHGDLTIDQVYERKDSDGYVIQYHCKLCARDGNIRRSFKGMNGMEDYQAMHDKQKGLCAICNNPSKGLSNNGKDIKSLAVDHCHNTQKVRGLLCQDCNTGIGYFKDNIKLLQSAIDYLKASI